MVAVSKMKMEVEVNLDDLLRWVDALSPVEKLALFEAIKAKAFRENLLALADEIPQANFSDDEVLEEIKAARRAR